MSQTKPIPQLSFSNAGSYKPVLPGTVLLKVPLLIYLLGTKKSG